MVLNDDLQELNEGEIWLVSIPGQHTVKTVKIVQLTTKTVQVEEMPRSYVKPIYQIKHLTFLEKVTK